MHAPTPQPRLLTLEEVADRLGITHRMARRLISERRVPVTKVGRLVRVADDALAAYIAANTQAARQ